MAISQRMVANSVDAPDESRPFASHGHMDVVHVGEATAAGCSSLGGAGRTP